MVVPVHSKGWALPSFQQLPGAGGQDPEAEPAVAALSDVVGSVYRPVRTCLISLETGCTSSISQCRSYTSGLHPKPRGPPVSLGRSWGWWYWVTGTGSLMGCLCLFVRFPW